MMYIETVAESWVNLYERNSPEWKAAKQSFLMGFTTASAQAVQALQRQHEGCQPGTLISYSIASEVLKLDMKEYENKGWS